MYNVRRTSTVVQVECEENTKQNKKNTGLQRHPKGQRSFAKKVHNDTVSFFRRTSGSILSVAIAKLRSCHLVFVALYQKLPTHNINITFQPKHHQLTHSHSSTTAMNRSSNNEFDLNSSPLKRDYDDQFINNNEKVDHHHHHHRRHPTHRHNHANARLPEPPRTPRTESNSNRICSLDDFVAATTRPPPPPPPPSSSSSTPPPPTFNYRGYTLPVPVSARAAASPAGAAFDELGYESPTPSLSPVKATSARRIPTTTTASMMARRTTGLVPIPTITPSPTLSAKRRRKYYRRNSQTEQTLLLSSISLLSMDTTPAVEGDSAQGEGEEEVPPPPPLPPRQPFHQQGEGEDAVMTQNDDEDEEEAKEQQQKKKKK